MRIALPSALVLLLSACASGPGKDQPFTLNELQVINNSSSLIHHMTVTLTDHEMTIDCGDINALGLCSKRFGRLAYNQAPMIVNWTFGDKKRRTDEIEISVPAYNSPGNPLYAVLEIGPQGGLKAYMVQAIPP